MVLNADELDNFIDNVSEVSRLIDGLKAGTISPEYVDTKLQDKASAKVPTPAEPAPSCKQHASPAEQEPHHNADANGKGKRDELQKKVEELKANRQRKLKARQLYESHVEQQKDLYATDYTKWGLWCPSDEDDDLFNRVTPSTPEFRAMEKDINERHNRMVEQRQIAERQRQQGNEAFKQKQYSEALRCYQVGLEAQRHNMALHGNAAMAAMKLKCYVQALEHCDKVLHLAEVLYNTPNDPLCVKALQRRATVRQAIGQHGKAVEDLQMACKMLPGDTEIQAQLERAQALLNEHGRAEKLKNMICKDQEAQIGDHELGQAIADSANLATLQRIGKLTAALSTSGSADTSKESTHGLKKVSQELAALLQNGPSHIVYFKECGGITAAVQQALQPQSLEALPAVMQLLTVACEGSTTVVEQLSQDQKLLGALLNHVGGSSNLTPPTTAVTAGATAACVAALELMYVMSTSTQGRHSLCQYLVQRQADGRLRLQVPWDACFSKDTAAARAVAALVLSNCLLLHAAREAINSILQQPDQLHKLAEQTQGDSIAIGTEPFVLLSNMSMHAGIRKQLAEHQQMLQQVLVAALPGAGGPKGGNSGADDAGIVDSSNSQAAALGCLCNLSLEQHVQQLVARSNQHMEQLLQLVTVEQTPTDAGQQAVSSTADSNSNHKIQHARSNVVLLKQRAACVLSRAAKQPQGLRMVQQQCALGQLVQTISTLVQQLMQSAQVNQQQVQGRQQCQEQGNVTSWAEAVLRVVVLLTNIPTTCSSCSSVDAASTIRACLAVLKSPAATEAMLGNAALCLSHFAAVVEWHNQLYQADVVLALTKVAHAGKGNAASKNAAIALARMAKDGRMMERLKELHGIEIIYQYVRP